MPENPWLTGWLQGDLKAHIDLNHLLKSAVWGELKGQGIAYPLKPDTPLKIDSLAVKATSHKINLQSTDVSISGNHFKVAGTITRSAQNALLDVDISAGSLDLDQIIRALDENREPTRGEKVPASQALPIQEISVSRPIGSTSAGSPGSRCTPISD